MVVCPMTHTGLMDGLMTTLGPTLLIRVMDNPCHLWPQGKCYSIEHHHHLDIRQADFIQKIKLSSDIILCLSIDLSPLS